MPVELFSWIIIAFFTGVAVRHFWDEIKQWANRVLGYILRGINTAIEVTSDVFVDLVKEATGRIVKRMKVYVGNIYNDNIKTKYEEESISPSQIPDEIKAQLKQKAELRLMQLAQQT